MPLSQKEFDLQKANKKMSKSVKDTRSAAPPPKKSFLSKSMTKIMGRKSPESEEEEDSSEFREPSQISDSRVDFIDTDQEQGPDEEELENQ